MRWRLTSRLLGGLSFPRLRIGLCGWICPDPSGFVSGFVPVWRAEAGVCARRRTYLLLLRQKKVGQEKTTPLPVSPSPVARGQPAMLEAGVRLGTRCVLRTPLKHLRRVRSRSACVLRHTRHPSFCASRHGQKGVGTGSIRAIASLGLWSFAALGSPWRLRRPSAARSAIRHPAQLRSSSRP